MRAVLEWSVAIFVLAPPPYFAFAFAGPYRWLALLQLHFFKGYSQLFSYLGAFFAWTIFATILIGIGGRLLVRTCGISPWAHSDAGFATLNRVFAAALLVAPLVGCAAGGCLWATAASLRDPDIIPVEAIGNVGLSTRFLTVTDSKPLFDQSVAISEQGRSNSRTEVFVPLVPTGWRSGDVIRAVARATDFGVGIGPKGAGRQDRAGEFTGLVGLTGLPGLVQWKFSNNGIRLADDVVLLRWGDKPSDAVFEGQLIAGVSLLFALVIWSEWIRRRWRKM